MTKIDSDIILLFKRSPQQIIRVKFVFDSTHEYFRSNAIQCDNDLSIFSSLVHSRTKDGTKYIVDATVQSLLCEKLANECISLEEIRSVRA